MFERLSDRARRVLVVAQHEAAILGSPKFGTEHILLAMVIEAEGIAGRTLRYFGVHEQVVRQTIIDHVAQVQHEGKLQLTPNGKKALELALRESLKLGSKRIGTEHLLLGVIQQENCSAVHVLSQLQVNLDKLRAIVVWATSGLEETVAALVRSGLHEEASKLLMSEVRGAEAVLQRVRVLHEELLVTGAGNGAA